ncbi:peptidylprolyl isomerase, partial [Vibrio fluvialis]|nr:peptidylprolyl isomerase [Vibrio fluvialis]
MMDRLREGVNSIAVKIILGLIILSFIFAGVGNYLISGSNNAAAKVGGTEIGRGEFEQAYQNERNRMQAQLGDYFANLLADPEYVASFRKSVLDRMINDLLLEQHAQSLGLRVSDDQIRQMILDMPQFQSEGKFDQEIYQSALRRAGFSPDSFAEYMRRDLVRNQLMSALQGSEFTLKGEVEAQGELISQTRDIRTITLSPAEFAKNVELSDDEIEQYYKQNPERYTRPEQVKLSYIELSAEQLKSAVTISDDQAQQYYQDHLDKYSSAEQRKVSHILIQGDDEKAAQEILDELKAGADFSTLAKEKSQDIGSAEEGGSLGWIEHDTMDPAFESAAFALKQAGDISGLVKSDFGYHIIKLDEVKAPIAKPYADVAADIKAELKDQQAVDKFYELQTELEKVAF